MDGAEGSAVVEIFSDSEGSWFVAIVVLAEPRALLVRFLDARGEPREKAVRYDDDAHVACLGTHLANALPPGVVAVPSTSRPGQLAYFDAEVECKYGTPELAWQAYLERHLLADDQEEFVGDSTSGVAGDSLAPALAASGLELLSTADSPGTAPLSPSDSLADRPWRTGRGTGEAQQSLAGLSPASGCWDTFEGAGYLGQSPNCYQNPPPACAIEPPSGLVLDGCSTTAAEAVRAAVALAMEDGNDLAAAFATSRPIDVCDNTCPGAAAAEGPPGGLDAGFADLLVASVPASAGGLVDMSSPVSHVVDLATEAIVATQRQQHQAPAVENATGLSGASSAPASALPRDEAPHDEDLQTSFVYRAGPCLEGDLHVVVVGSAGHAGHACDASVVVAAAGAHPTATAAAANASLRPEALMPAGMAAGVGPHPASAAAALPAPVAPLPEGPVVKAAAKPGPSREGALMAALPGRGLGSLAAATASPPQVGRNVPPRFTKVATPDSGDSSSAPYPAAPTQDHLQTPTPATVSWSAGERMVVAPGDVEGCPSASRGQQAPGAAGTSMATGRAGGPLRLSCSKRDLPAAPPAGTAPRLAYAQTAAVALEAEPCAGLPPERQAPSAAGAVAAYAAVAVGQRGSVRGPSTDPRARVASTDSAAASAAVTASPVDPARASATAVEAHVCPRAPPSHQTPGGTWAATAAASGPARRASIGQCVPCAGGDFAAAAPAARGVQPRPVFGTGAGPQMVELPSFSTPMDNGAGCSSNQAAYLEAVGVQYSPPEMPDAPRVSGLAADGLAGHGPAHAAIGQTFGSVLPYEGVAAPNCRAGPGLAGGSRATIGQTIGNVRPYEGLAASDGLAGYGLADSSRAAIGQTVGSIMLHDSLAGDALDWGGRASGSFANGGKASGGPPGGALASDGRTVSGQAGAGRASSSLACSGQPGGGQAVGSKSRGGQPNGSQRGKPTGSGVTNGVPRLRGATQACGTTCRRSEAQAAHSGPERLLVGPPPPRGAERLGR